MDNFSTVVRKIQPRDYDIFVGMDTDSRSIALTALDHLGLAKAVAMPHAGDVVLGYVHNHFAGKAVVFAYEAGPTGFGLYDTISAAGYTCLVVTPSAVPTARGKRVRTNRLDSMKIALQLRGGGLEGIRVPRDDYRELRELVTLRKMHMTAAAKCKQRIKALFLRSGMEFPSATPGGYWSRQLIGELRELSCSQARRFKLDSLLDSLLFSQYQALQSQRKMREFVGANAEISESVDYAMSLPGVGWIVATYAIARIGDYREMGSSDETSSFLGLVQTEDTTGDRTNRGSITKAGDPVLRSLMIEASWTAIRKDTELMEFYQRMYRTHSTDKAARIAIVAVARKLATRLHCVLKERRKYEARV